MASLMVPLSRVIFSVRKYNTSSWWTETQQSAQPSGRRRSAGESGDARAHARGWEGWGERAGIGSGNWGTGRRRREGGVGVRGAYVPEKRERGRGSPGSGAGWHES